MTFFTIYALFFDDIRVLVLPKELDDVCYTLTIILIIIFGSEIIVFSIAKEGYLYSFFFWLDLVSTLSLVFDIGWIMDNYINDTIFINATSLIKTSRAGRITRVIRVIRLIRIFRIVKLYKTAKLAEKKKQDSKSREI